MAKSTSILFILLVSVFLSLESCNVLNGSVAGLICAGLLLFNYKSTQFNWQGFLMTEAAALCCGVRWAVCQKLVQRDVRGIYRLPVAMISTQPWMILGILPLCLYFEGKRLSLLLASPEGHESLYLSRTSLLICFGGMLATVMELTEYLLLLYTSSLTLSNFQEVVTLVIAYYYKGDIMSVMNIVGLVMCLSGTLLHVVNRTRMERHKSARNAEHRSDCLRDLHKTKDWSAHKIRRI
ncbi:unnamed protein product [Soboliphyme baturini]|uniref:TPT domain-containing protein n=1 Tax=Soboliphyme baturini TaxID=241478 RepID=A0A183IQD5_9BILA|nr:unnamed protein product [Soboliphyme baturini]